MLHVQVLRLVLCLVRRGCFAKPRDLDMLLKPLMGLLDGRNDRPYPRADDGDDHLVTSHILWFSVLYSLNTFLFSFLSVHFTFLFSFLLGRQMAQRPALVTITLKTACHGFRSRLGLFFFCMWHLFTRLDALLGCSLSCWLDVQHQFRTLSK